MSTAVKFEHDDSNNRSKTTLSNVSLALSRVCDHTDNDTGRLVISQSLLDDFQHTFHNYAISNDLTSHSDDRLSDLRLDQILCRSSCWYSADHYFSQITTKIYEILIDEVGQNARVVGAGAVLALTDIFLDISMSFRHVEVCHRLVAAGECLYCLLSCFVAYLNSIALSSKDQLLGTVTFVFNKLVLAVHQLQSRCRQEPSHMFQLSLFLIWICAVSLVAQFLDTKVHHCIQEISEMNNLQKNVFDSMVVLLHTVQKSLSNSSFLVNRAAESASELAYYKIMSNRYSSLLPQNQLALMNTLFEVYSSEWVALYNKFNGCPGASLSHIFHAQCMNWISGRSKGVDGFSLIFASGNTQFVSPSSRPTISSGILWSQITNKTLASHLVEGFLGYACDCFHMEQVLGYEHSSGVAELRACNKFSSLQQKQGTILDNMKLNLMDCISLVVGVQLTAAYQRHLQYLSSIDLSLPYGMYLIHACVVADRAHLARLLNLSSGQIAIHLAEILNDDPSASVETCTRLLQYAMISTSLISHLDIHGTQIVGIFQGIQALCDAIIKLQKMLLLLEPVHNPSKMVNQSSDEMDRLCNIIWVISKLSCCAAYAVVHITFQCPDIWQFHRTTEVKPGCGPLGNHTIPSLVDLVKSQVAELYDRFGNQTGNLNDRVAILPMTALPARLKIYLCRYTLPSMISLSGGCFSSFSSAKQTDIQRKKCKKVLFSVIFSSCFFEKLAASLGSEMIIPVTSNKGGTLTASGYAHPSIHSMTQTCFYFSIVKDLEQVASAINKQKLVDERQLRENLNVVTPRSAASKQCLDSKDICIAILSYLTVKRIHAFSLVNKSMHSYCNDNFLWKIKYFQEWGSKIGGAKFESEYCTGISRLDPAIGHCGSHKNTVVKPNRPKKLSNICVNCTKFQRNSSINARQGKTTASTNRQTPCNSNASSHEWRELYKVNCDYILYIIYTFRVCGFIRSIYIFLIFFSIFSFNSVDKFHSKKYLEVYLHRLLFLLQ